MTTRKNIIILLCLTMLLTACRNNAQPGTTYGPDQMLNQYLFGPLSLNTKTTGISNPSFYTI
ncbi:MAG TPA: hypothetical protein VFG10_16045 [Saprospiraceae bacterium]|nr:hypothetical protein [Saprospiraceae bacterium]